MISWYIFFNHFFSETNCTSFTSEQSFLFENYEQNITATSFYRTSFLAKQSFDTLFFQPQIFLMKYSWLLVFQLKSIGIEEVATIFQKNCLFEGNVFTKIFAKRQRVTDYDFPWKSFWIFPTLNFNFIRLFNLFKKISNTKWCLVSQLRYGSI